MSDRFYSQAEIFEDESGEKGLRQTLLTLRSENTLLKRSACLTTMASSLVDVVDETLRTYAVTLLVNQMKATTMWPFFNAYNSEDSLNHSRFLCIKL